MVRTHRRPNGRKRAPGVVLPYGRLSIPGPAGAFSADTVTTCTVYSGAVGTSKPNGLCGQFNQTTNCTTLTCNSGRYLTNAAAPYWYGLCAAFAVPLRIK